MATKNTLFNEYSMIQKKLNIRNNKNEKESTTKPFKINEYLETSFFSNVLVFFIFM